MNEKELKQYYKNIKKNVAQYKRKRRLLIELKSGIERFMEEKPNCTIEDIIHHFGNADTISESYLEDINVLDLKRKVMLSNIVKFSISLISLVLIVICIVSFIRFRVKVPDVKMETLTIYKNRN